jgi:hypothetical protein
MVTEGAKRLPGDRCVQEDPARLGQEFIDLLTVGAIKPLPITRLKFTDTLEGLTQLTGSHVRGKLVAEIP